jgi:hypothetical protein
MHSKPDSRNLPVLPRSLQLLAYASLGLSLSPLVLAPLALAIAISSASSAKEFSYATLWPALVFLIGGHVASISALVIGIVVEGRASKYPPPRPTRIAVAGIVIGGVGLAALGIFDIVFVVLWILSAACAGQPPGVCGP